MNRKLSIALLFSAFSALLSTSAGASLSSEHYPDLYGSVLFDKAPSMSMDVAVQRGYGDSYGSILLDPPPMGTLNFAAQPGYGDNYGSVLLDLPSQHKMHSVVHQSPVTGSLNI